MSLHDVPQRPDRYIPPLHALVAKRRVMVAVREALLFELRTCNDGDVRHQCKRHADLYSRQLAGLSFA